MIISILSCIPVVGILYNSRNIMLLIVKDKQIAMYEKNNNPIPFIFFFLKCIKFLFFLSYFFSYRVAYDYILYYLPSLFVKKCFFLKRIFIKHFILSVYFLKFMSISNVIIKYIQSQNIVIPLMIINVIAFVFNAIFHAIFLHVFKMGVMYEYTIYIQFEFLLHKITKTMIFF